MVLIWDGTEIPWRSACSAFACAFAFRMFIPDVRLESTRPALPISSLVPFIYRHSKLIDLLGSVTYFHASEDRDDRDRIFALIGLADDAGPLRADYTLTVGETYACALKHIIQSSQKLRALAYVSHHGLTMNDGIPTWAPDWKEAGCARLASMGNFAASGVSSARWQDSEDWDTLSLAGLMQDRVKAVKFAPDVNALTSEFLLEVFQLAMDNKCSEPVKQMVWTITAGHANSWLMAGQSGKSDKVSTSDPEHLQNFMACLHDRLAYDWCVSKPGRCLRQSLALIDAALDALPPHYRNIDRSDMPEYYGHESFESLIRKAHSFDATVADTAMQGLNRVRRTHNTQKAGPFLHQLEVAVTWRACFVTNDGIMGLGPAWMAEGDVICILFGGSTPYVLRPTGSDGEFHFIGECYVYGIMDGEAMTEYENGEVTETWFHWK